MKSRRRPRRSTAKKGPGKLTPRRLMAAINRKANYRLLEIEHDMRLDEIFNQA